MGVHERARARRASSAYRARNPEAVKEQYARWYAANAETKRARSLDWYRENRERAAEVNARWYLENVDRSQAKTQRRRTVTRGAEVEQFSPLEIFERDGWICQLCRHPVDPETRFPHRDSASLDHVIPLCKGGPHSRSNTQLAHRHCNEAKGGR